MDKANTMLREARWVYPNRREWKSPNSFMWRDKIKRKELRMLSAYTKNKDVCMITLSASVKLQNADRK